MTLLKDTAEKPKISKSTLMILLIAAGVLLITSAVLLAVFWEDLQYHREFGRFPQGDSLAVVSVFAVQDSSPLLDNAVILSDDVGSGKTELGCMGEEANCELVLYQQSNGKPLTMISMLINEQTGYPLTITGISLEFTGYRPYREINLGTPRSGSVDTSFDITDRLKLVPGGDEIEFPWAAAWLALQMKDPSSVVGEYFFLDMAEGLTEDAVLPQMKADEVEFFSVLLPFTDETPSGWYAFQYSVLYETPEGDRYRTEPQVMNVIVPEKVNLFRYTINEGVFDGARSFVSYQPFTDQLSAERVAVSPASAYTMLLETSTSNDKQHTASLYWKYDLMTGDPTTIHPPYSMGGVYPSNDGWKQVIMMPDYEWALYDLAEDRTILLDETSRFTSPVWSPADRKLAFYHSTQANTIGIFDVATEEMRETPLTITGTLKDMQWLSEDTLVLLVHSGEITFFYAYHPADKSMEVIHSVAGINEDSFVITSQGSIVAINDEFGVTIPHLKRIYPLEYGSAGVDGWYCVWLPNEFIAFCSTGGEVYLVDQVNESTEKILEFGGLVGIESQGPNGVAVISTEDIVYLFDIHGVEQSRFHLEGISEQRSFDLRYTFLQNP